MPRDDGESGENLRQRMVDGHGDDSEDEPAPAETIRYSTGDSPMLQSLLIGRFEKMHRVP